MTDKQIIIDVTKCIHFDKSDIPNGCTCYWDGECNHDCYYKKYTYKEQECQDLRNLISTFGATGICEVCTDKSVLISDEYTKAIKQIKEIAQWAVKSPMSSATEITKFEGILKTIELAEKRIDEAKNNSKYFKLKQTLEEIKEIAENNKKSTLCFTAFESDAIEVNNEPMATILQKISECEV